MAKELTKDSLFKPPPTRMETKAEITDHVARSIMQAEMTARDAKTARLREARLAREAGEQDKPPRKPSKSRSR